MSGLFGRLSQLFDSRKPEAPASPAAAAPLTSGLRSPQGWQDEDPGWPPGAGVYSTEYPSPWIAAEQADMAIASLRRLDEVLVRDESRAQDLAAEYHAALGRFGGALRALYLPDTELSGRKGTYGRLVVLLEVTLKDLPQVLGDPVVATHVRYLIEDLQDCYDADLARAGATLEVAADAARAAAKPLPLNPDGEAAEAPAEAEVAAPVEAPVEAPVAAPVAAPAQAEIASPPGDLTPQLVMRCLLEECLQDGRLDPHEERTIGELRQLLRIPAEDYSTLFREVSDRVRSGELRQDRALDPIEFFAKIYQLSLLDDRITEAEQQVLATAANYLCLTRDEFQAIRFQVLLRRDPDAAPAPPGFASDDTAASMTSGPTPPVAAWVSARKALEAGAWSQALAHLADYLASGTAPAPRAAEALLARARCLRRTSELEAAEQGAVAALRAFTGLGPEAELGVAACLGELGLIHRRQGRLPEACERLLAAAKLQEKHRPEGHPQTGVAYANYAAACFTHGDHDAAERAFQRALSVLRASLGEDDTKVAGLLGGLAGVHRAQGRTEQASEEYQRALKALGYARGAKHRELIGPLLGYASLLEAEGHGQFALRLRTRAGAIQAEY